MNYLTEGVAIAAEDAGSDKTNNPLRQDNIMNILTNIKMAPVM